jgi:1,6-anhydro-N-acetylmuramate kinase
MAATLATLWALDPSRTREEVLAALVASSNFFQERREKHPVFGWGKVDTLQAARIVLREKPLPEELTVCESVCR